MNDQDPQCPTCGSRKNYLETKEGGYCSGCHTGWGAALLQALSTTLPKVGQNAASGPLSLTFGGDRKQEAFAQPIAEWEAAVAHVVDAIDRTPLKAMDPRDWDKASIVMRLLEELIATLRYNSARIAIRGAKAPRAPKVSGVRLTDRPPTHDRKNDIP